MCHFYPGLSVRPRLIPSTSEQGSVVQYRHAGPAGAGVRRRGVGTRLESTARPLLPDQVRAVTS